jgi:ketosteroid isomerase-like protein
VTPAGVVGNAGLRANPRRSVPVGPRVPRRRACAATLSLAVLTAAALAQEAAIDARPLPLARRRLPASAEECVVWKRELGFARSVEAHDAPAFESFLQPGAVFDAGTADAAKGRDNIVKGWADIVAGQTIALRWRPGIVQIGGEPGIAVSRGTFVLQRLRDGVPVFRVGMFQSVWVRDARDGAWRVLFDGSATGVQAVQDRAEADRWVEDQPMSDCAE